MNFLEKLHYTILKEIHYQSFIINYNDVPNPNPSQIINVIEARNELGKLKKQEHRVRTRIYRKNKKL